MLIDLLIAFLAFYKSRYFFLGIQFICRRYNVFNKTISFCISITWPILSLEEEMIDWVKIKYLRKKFDD